MRIEDSQLRSLLETEYNQFKKELNHLLENHSEELIEGLLSNGVTTTILTLADSQSNKQASQLGLPITELARLYKLEYVFSLKKELDRLRSLVWFDFVSTDLRVNDKEAGKHISESCEIKLRKKQEMMVRSAEKVSKELAKLKKELAKEGATSLPINNIITFDYKGNPSVNTAYILTIR